MDQWKVDFQRTGEQTGKDFTQAELVLDTCRLATSEHSLMCSCHWLLSGEWAVSSSPRGTKGSHMQHYTLTLYITKPFSPEDIRRC